MPKSCDTFTWLSPLLTHSTAFTLSLTVHTFHLWLDMMLCYCANDCCSGDGAACPRCHPLPAAARPALYRSTALNPDPFTACMFTIRLHPPSLCVWLDCYDLLQCTHVLTDCTSTEATNLKLGLTEKSGSMTSTALWPNLRYIEARYNEGAVYYLWYVSKNAINCTVI